MKFHIIIPARLASTRLPNKILLDIAGKPMIQHVYERALQSGALSVVVATDDNSIREVAENFGASVCMTSVSHRTGTERLAEAVEKLGHDDEAIIVNVQGDEPLIPPKAISQAAYNLHINADAAVATLCVPITSYEELHNPNVVKVVMDKAGYALYFSRAPIAWDRDANAHNNLNFSSYAYYYRHVGLYAYRASAIKHYMNLPESYLERMESLEQLRVLWHGGRIHVDAACETMPPGVDTLADLHLVSDQLKNL